MLGQVLVNLVVNARDAMPNGGSITVSTHAEEVIDATGPSAVGRFATIRVEDTGLGIEPEHLARVFEPFFTTKASGRGTGLGLSTVLGIVEQAGGYVRVTSEPGRGSTFIVRIPCTERPASPKASAPPDVPRRPVRSTVLLVEDDENVRDATRALLARGNFEVLVAASGEEALALAARSAGRIDLLLTDVVMPGMNGIELAQRVLADHPGTGVLLMTGYSELPSFATSLLAPTPHTVAKPLTLQSLLAAVDRVLEAREAEEVA